MAVYDGMYDSGNSSPEKTRVVPIPDKKTGVDTEGAAFKAIIGAGQSKTLDINALSSLSGVATSRNQLYSVFDMMSEDSQVASIIETYAEDATEANEQGKIIWVESNDEEVAKTVEYILDELDLDSHMYAYANQLIRYGDVFLRLYRKSDEEEMELDSSHSRERLMEGLDESIILQAHQKNDHYSGYIEMIKNPAEVLELTKKGKASLFIKTNVQQMESNKNNLPYSNYSSWYSFNTNDIQVFMADDFVHGYLEDVSSRTPERVRIFLDEGQTEEGNPINPSSYEFNIRRGQSLLYSAFQAWRTMSLMRGSVLLNRVSKSSLFRIIGIELGEDVPGEEVPGIVQEVKGLFEQKLALNQNQNMTEYNNAGPVENLLFMPTIDGKGAITSTDIGGGEVGGNLNDFDSFVNAFYGAFRVPKQYFGLTDDAAGFNGGSSLTIISSRYAKSVKRLQFSLTRMATTVVNLYLLDMGKGSYINNFTLKMQAPTTQEDLDRRENTSNKVNIVRDIMDLLSDIEDNKTRLSILKTLLSTVITDTEVITLIQEEIDKLEAENTADEGSGDELAGPQGSSGASEVLFGANEPEEEIFNTDLPTPENIEGEKSPALPEEGEDIGSSREENNPEEGIEDHPGELLVEDSFEGYDLPTPDDLGIDMTQNY